MVAQSIGERLVAHATRYAVTRTITTTTQPVQQHRHHEPHKTWKAVRRWGAGGAASSDPDVAAGAGLYARAGLYASFTPLDSDVAVALTAMCESRTLSEKDNEELLAVGVILFRQSPLQLDRKSVV